MAFLKEVDACCKEKGSDHQSSDAEKDGEDGCTDLCSPFQPCCPYVAFSTSITTVEQPKPLPIIEKGFPLYQVKFISKYTSDFWQPPRAV